MSRKLGQREKQLTLLSALGLTQPDVAQALELAEGTVKTLGRRARTSSSAPGLVRATFDRAGYVALS